MSNKPLTSQSSKEVAHNLFYSWIEELAGKLARVEDKNVLEELKEMAFQKNDAKIIKLVDARLSQL